VNNNGNLYKDQLETANLIVELDMSAKHSTLSSVIEQGWQFLVQNIGQRASIGAVK
jgi:hypothetical protein